MFTSTNLLQKTNTTTVSRAPLGDEVRAGKQFVAARFSNLFVCGSYQNLNKRNSDGATTENNPNAAKAQQILELTLRQTMSKVLGVKLQSAQSLTIFGFAHPAFQRPGRPKIIKLATLAAHANFSPEYDAELGLYRFQWRGKSVVVPLASDQVKVNGVWKKLGEFVLQKNKETYIDPVGLDAAVGN